MVNKTPRCVRARPFQIARKRNVEHAQTKTMKVEVRDGRISSQRLHDRAVVVAGERASNRGIKNRCFFLQQQHIYQRVTGNETGKTSLTGCTVQLSDGNPRC